MDPTPTSRASAEELLEEFGDTLFADLPPVSLQPEFPAPLELLRAIDINHEKNHCSEEFVESEKCDKCLPYYQAVLRVICSGEEPSNSFLWACAKARFPKTFS